MEGKVVNRIPPRNSKDIHIDWDKAARTALDHPEQAVLAAEHVPISRITSLRSYHREPFVDDNGDRKVTIHMRNSVVEVDHQGRQRRYGDVYLQSADYDD